VGGRGRQTVVRRYDGPTLQPAADRLRAIAASSDGSIAEVPYAMLLAALALTKRDGVAVLERRRTQKKIAFSGGVPFDCRSNLLHETFGRYLVSQGKISEETFQVVQAQSSATGIRFGEVLVGRGLMPADELSRQLQQSLARRLLDAFTWREGTYRILPEPVVPEAPPKLNVAQLILTGISKFAPQAAVDAAVGALVGQRLALCPEPPFPLQEMRLSEAQLRLASALEKRPRLDELAVSVPLPFEEITRLVYALWLLGTVVPADQLRATAPPKPAPPRIAPIPTSVPVTSRADTVPLAVPETIRRSEEVLRAWEGLRGRDAFDLLGLPDTADEPAALARFVERARAWAPWGLDGEAAEKATVLFSAAAKAYARLADPESREALRQARRRPAEPAKPAPQVFAIKTDLLDPEAQHRKGAEHLAAGKYQQALPFLEFAADCDPQNGSYAADASWCRYLASGKTTGGSTLAELEEAARIDPKSGLACFYAGEICRARGDVARAEPYYRKAARLMAPDRRPLDALREMAKPAR